MLLALFAAYTAAVTSPCHDLLQGCVPVIDEVDIPGGHNAQQLATQSTGVCHTYTAEILRQLHTQPLSRASLYNQVTRRGYMPHYQTKSTSLTLLMSCK